MTANVVNKIAITNAVLWLCKFLSLDVLPHRRQPAHVENAALQGHLAWNEESARNT